MGRGSKDWIFGEGKSQALLRGKRKRKLHTIKVYGLFWLLSSLKLFFSPCCFFIHCPETCFHSLSQSVRIKFSIISSTFLESYCRDPVWDGHLIRIIYLEPDFQLFRGRDTLSHNCFLHCTMCSVFSIWVGEYNYSYIK